MCVAPPRIAGADFVKTSTGFHPAGGASVRAVALMADTVGGRLGVKASGGIRTAADAVAMLDAGATRLGLSGTRAVLDGLTSSATAQNTLAGVRSPFAGQMLAKQGSWPSLPVGMLAFWVEKWLVTPRRGHLHAVGVDAQRIVLGQVGGEVVQRRLHGLFGQREAERVEADDLQLQARCRTPPAWP